MKERVGEKIKLSLVNELLGVGNEESAITLDVSKIKAFQNHPFYVQEDARMKELIESIRCNGILTPVLVRPTDEGYEMVSGHRRKFAAEYLGMKKIPAIIREMNDEEATVTMVDSNIQREEILPSEKAFAYKMKMEALNRQGTSRQVGEKLSVTQISEASNDSERQVHRYIRLTNLIPGILEMVDEGKIALTPAVELTYLTATEQIDLLETMESEDCTPSLSQAQQLKQLSQAGQLDMDKIFNLLREPKANQQEKIIFRVEELRKFFPQNYSTLRIQETILRILRDYQRRQMYDRGGR